MAEKMKTMKIEKISELYKVIKKIIDPESRSGHFGRIESEKTCSDLPLVIDFCKGMEFDNFKITIENMEKDYYIDKNGTKWIRSEE